MLNGIVFTLGCMAIVVSRFLYFIAEDGDGVAGAITLDVIGTFLTVTSLLSNFGIIQIT